MKRALVQVFLVAFVFAVVGCGGGETSDGAGGSSGATNANPDSIAGTYSGTWEGRGTSATGTFVCSGEFVMVISQSGAQVVVALTLVTGSGECDDFFAFSGSGSYVSSTGEISVSAPIGDNTVNLVGTATGQTGQVTINGRWSTIVTNSANVVASGTWTAQMN